MRRKTRYILATVAAVGIGLLGVSIYLHYHTIGQISWFKFPFYESDPIVEFVYYEDELLYFACWGRAVDIHLTRNNLIEITDYSSRQVFYDTQNKQFIPKGREGDYEYISTGDDRYITDYYNVATDSATRWRQRLLEY